MLVNTVALSVVGANFTCFFERELWTLDVEPFAYRTALLFDTCIAGTKLVKCNQGGYSTSSVSQYATPRGVSILDDSVPGVQHTADVDVFLGNSSEDLTRFCIGFS